jgi:glutamate dehydrogenase (NAD(P)+)
LMTGPDLGTYEDDFAGLPTPGGSDGIAAASGNGMPVEELLTGCGVVSAIAAALGGDVEGRTVAIEGFGKMGASIARDLDRRGGRIVAVSTIAGCAVAPPRRTFPLEQLLEARDRSGEQLVRHLGVRPLPPAALWMVECDSLVPGARPGVLDESTARRVVAGAVVPVANAPYTAGGLEVLKRAGVVAYADFVTSAGGAMTYLSPRVAAARDIDDARIAVDELMRALVEETSATADGPYAGAVALAERYLRKWLPEPSRPARPPLA